MKRNERTNYNHISRAIRKNGIESIVNIEVPTTYTHEARQAFHELLTSYNLRAVCIYWNDIEKTWALHYEPARYPEAHDEKRRQEAEDVDTVTARMIRRNWTWNGYPAPADQVEAEPAQEDPTTAPAAEAEQQPQQAEEPQQPAQERPQRIYNIYFTDHPQQAMTVKARTKREAEKAGRLYIRQWGLDASIDRIDRAEA